MAGPPNGSLSLAPVSFVALLVAASAVSAGPNYEEMVRVPAGPFKMGYDFRIPDERPMHTVTLPAYWIDRYEVTNARYQKFVDATAHPPPRHWQGNQPPPGKANHPVVYVSWHDADAYCRWAGRRLPTEEEWEKAARGADGRLFPWGDKFDSAKANTPQAKHGGTMPVGSLPKGRSPYGLYDMAGNVYEWTDSWYVPYPGNTRPNPNFGKRLRVVRGGSWIDCTFYRCGLSAFTFNRAVFKPETMNEGFGFRCARSDIP